MLKIREECASGEWLNYVPLKNQGFYSWSAWSNVNEKWLLQGVGVNLSLVGIFFFSQYALVIKKFNLEDCD